MADSDDTTTRHGLGAQLWGAVKGALIDEDPVAAARRNKLQGGNAPAAKPAAVDAAPAAMSPMAQTLMAHFATPASPGVWQTFVVMGLIYFVFMMGGALAGGTARRRK